MKKSVLAAALAAVMLLSGCSGVSQESGNSVVDESSSLQTESSSSSTTTSSSASSSSSSESESNDDEDYTTSIKNNFISKIEDLEKYVDGFYISSSSALNKQNLVDTSGEISLGYEEIYAGRFLTSGEDVTNLYLIFYLDDVSVNCALIYNAMDTVKRLLDYVEGSKLYTIYIDDSKNEHIVTISNFDTGSLSTPQIYWYNSAAQEKYETIESSDYFKDFKVKVVNQ